MAKRIYLHAANNDGSVHYPGAGFYQNVPDVLADKWVAEKLANYASDDNTVIPWPPDPPMAEEQPAIDHQPIVEESK